MQNKLEKPDREISLERYCLGIETEKGLKDKKLQHKFRAQVNR